MPVKYFSSLCTMNSKDLRANPFHHTCLVFYKTSCDEQGNLTSPLQVLTAYGFYSHSVPAPISLFADPFTFFSQKLKIGLRLRGSYGEWKLENIHDLSYGRGLSGFLFEVSERQAMEMMGSIDSRIQYQQAFFHGVNDIQEREEFYSASLTNKLTELVEYGIEIDAAKIIAKQEIHMPEFNFGFTANSYTCKVAALNVLEEYLDMCNEKIAEHIQHLKENPAVPRFTQHLKNIVIHAMTDHWESCGDQSKYPYCSWENFMSDKNASLIVVDFGGQYVDLNGDMKTIFRLSERGLGVVDDLKSIGRLCEINIADSDYSEWHNKICDYISNIASSKNDEQLNIQVKFAEKYLTDLVCSEIFQNKIDGNIPINLLNRVEDTLSHYGIDSADEVMRQVWM